MIAINCALAFILSKFEPSKEVFGVFEKYDTQQLKWSFLNATKMSFEDISTSFSFDIRLYRTKYHSKSW